MTRERCCPAPIPLGHATLYDYDAQGREIRQTDPLGNYTETDYDEFGNVIREERYDADNNLLTRDEYTYDANNNKITETYYQTMDGTFMAVTATYEYNALSLVVAATDPLGGVTRYEYDASNQQTAVIDALGRRTKTEYDENGEVLRVTYPDGTWESYAYDGNGNTIEERARTGAVTRYEYDELDRRVKTHYADGSLEETILTPGGRVKAEIDANGNRTDYDYDTAGRQIRTLYPPVLDPVTELPVRPEMVTELDAAGRRVAGIDGNGHRTEYTHDALGRLVATEYPDGATTSRRLSALDQVLSETDAEGRATLFTYDALNNLVEVQLPEPEPGAGRPASTYTYDERGNRLSQTDALGRTTTFAYDVLGREVARTLPDGATMTYAIDLAGRVVRRTDYNGDAIEYDYDAMDNAIRKRYPDGRSIEFAYDAAEQVKAITDTRGVTTYAYDPLNRLVRVDHPDGTFIENTYDNVGNRTATTTPSGTVQYRYDRMNRLESVRDMRSQTVYFHDPGGNRVRQLVLPQGLLTEYTYDSVNRLTGIVQSQVEPDLSTTVLESYDYAVSPMGHRLQSTERDGSVVNYTYDGLYRLVQETRTGSVAYTISYEYDAVGNRTRMIRNGNTTVYDYDNRDRLVAEDAITYDYDANGNLIEKDDGASVTTYAYDYENRMIEKASGGNPVAYTYDGYGELVAVESVTETLRFLVDRQNSTGYSQTVEERDGEGNVLASYTYGDDLVSMLRGGEAFTYLYDGTHSTRLLVNALNEITDRWIYDAFGRIVNRIGATENRYLYTGERFDPNTGFYYLRARFYSPQNGRFTALDPFDGRIQDPMSLHKYLYASANPIFYIDPSGQFNLISVMGALATRAVQIYNTYKFICKTKTGVIAVSEIAYWTQVFAAIAVVSSNWKVGAKFSVERFIRFDKEQVKKTELRLYLKPGTGKTYLQLSIEKVSGTRIQFEININDPSDIQFKFGKNITISEFSVCGSDASFVKVDLAFRIIPFGVADAASNPNASAADYATSFWSIGFDVTVLNFWKFSFPVLGRSAAY